MGEGEAAAVPTDMAINIGLVRQPTAFTVQKMAMLAVMEAHSRAFAMGA
jgi:hypothetical protein